ncbi:MAG TPA: pitrilysin family protein [Anaerolineaceae bacterium]
MTSTPVTFTQLPNGLTIHLKEIHTAPIISHWVWYRVGSRNETPGITGISHWVEHMMFKGTKMFPSGVLDKAISREGGYWNAFTYLDWTTYFETLPADKIDLALRLEANRMVETEFVPEEVDSERTVIISERQGHENEPLFRLGEAVQKAAFRSHPYHHEVIGEVEDLQKITRDDLYNHYRGHYNPSNAVVALAGDFDTQAMLARLQELYGNMPAGNVPEYHPALEAPQSAEQRLEVSGPGHTTYLQLAYRAPAAAHPDFFAFSVLDSLLTGATGLNMFGGGGVSNKTSRLYRKLVEGELVVNVSGGLQATLDPFLYDITATVRPGRTPQEALSVIDSEIQRLQDGQVSAEEIARAIKQARALFAYGSENITNQAFWLGYAEMFDHYAWFEQYTERLAQVTAQDIQRAAQEYLVPSNRVVGAYLPTGEESGEEEEE